MLLHIFNLFCVLLSGKSKNIVSLIIIITTNLL